MRLAISIKFAHLLCKGFCIKEALETILVEIFTDGTVTPIMQFLLIFFPLSELNAKKDRVKTKDSEIKLAC